MRKTDRSVNPGRIVMAERLGDRTLRSMLTDPLIADIAEDAISKWNLSKEEFYNWTLDEIGDKMGWRCLERSFTRLFAAARTGNYYFKLYDEKERLADTSRENVNFVYLPSDKEGAGDKPFILLIPGGGFVNVWSMTEGWPVAAIFNELGYNVFILTYRVSVEASAVKAMEDIASAMKIISSKKDEFGVDPDRYITCGFSAGGYVACLWNTEKGYRAYGIRKPEAIFPIYPVTSYKLIAAEDWGEDNGMKPVRVMDGVGCSMEEACNSCFEIPDHVEGFPPTAIFVAGEDELVDPDHSRNLAKALDAAGIPCRLEIGPTGGHGFADGIGMCMEGWPQRAIEWYEESVDGKTD